MNLADALAELQRVAAEAPREDLPSMLGALEQAKATAWARLATPQDATELDNGKAPDENLPVAEAARRLGISASFLYKHKDSLPFVVRIGRRVVCSAREVERWNRRRTGLSLRVS